MRVSKLKIGDLLFGSFCNIRGKTIPLEYEILKIIQEEGGTRTYVLQRKGVYGGKTLLLNSVQITKRFTATCSKNAKQIIRLDNSSELEKYLTKNT